MFGLDAIVRERVKQTPDPIKGLLDRMISEENAWWAITRRSLPSRKLLAMYYENFRIAQPDVNSMYMAKFAVLDYDNYGDKNAEKFWEDFKKGAANMAHLMTTQGLTERLVSETKNSKHLFVEEVRNIRKEPNSNKWDYGDIGKMIDERFVVYRTKKQKEEHNAKLVEEINGKISKDRKANKNTKKEGERE